MKTGQTYRFSVKRKGVSVPIEYVGIYLGHASGYERFLQIEKNAVEIHVADGLLTGDPQEVQLSTNT